MDKDHTESSQIREEKRRRKKIKLAAYLGAFMLLQVVEILVFVLVVMKFRTPRFRIGNGIEIHSLTTENTRSSSPSFNLNFTAPMRIKNANFGPYKYDAATVNFTYEGVNVGQVTILKSKANFRSTKKVDVTVSLNSDTLKNRTSGLESQLRSGVLTLGSQGRLNGKVELMLFFKKEKSTDMNCTVAISVSDKALRSLTCN